MRWDIPAARITAARSDKILPNRSTGYTPPMMYWAAHWLVDLFYLIAPAATFRPRVVSAADPFSIAHIEFKTVKFDASDGTHLSGWWIPAPRPTGKQIEDLDDDFATKTVIACHGLGGNKTSLLTLVRY